LETLLEYGVLACFVALVLTPFGLPIPEEISLLTAGVIVANGHSNIPTGWIFGFLGVTMGDVIAWYFGRRVGLVPTGFVGKLIGEKQITEIEQFYRKWGDWAIVIARQVPGMRFPTFFFAGASAVSLGRFYLIDGLSALITVSVYFGLGYIFADDIGEIKGYVIYFVDYAGVLASIFLFTLISLIIYRRIK
jgi:membrane protein DedA with SNARE-associated domain